MPKKLPIFYSALLLTGVNLLLRLVGTSFQVYISGRIGAAGVGLLQLTMSVGSLAMVTGIAGVRTATMYLTAEELGKKRPGNVTWVSIRLLRVQHSVQHGRGRRPLFSRACAGGKLDWGRAHGEFPAAVCRVPSRLLPVRRHDGVFHRGQPHRDAGRGGGGRAAVLHGRDHGRADPLGGRRPRTCLSERGHGRMLRRLSDAVLPDAAAPCRTGKAGAENPHKEPSFTGSRPPCHGGRTEIRHQHHGKPDGPQASGAELPH